MPRLHWDILQADALPLPVPQLQWFWTNNIYSDSGIHARNIIQ